MLVGCLLLALIGGVLLVLWTLTAGSQEASGPATVSPTRPAAEREAGLGVGEREAAPGPARTGVIQEVFPRPGPAPEPDLRLLTDASRFEGVGTLRVEARTPSGIAFPADWVLVLEPSQALIGGEHARERRVPMSDGESSVVIDDLPLGGYDVFAEAPLLNCARKRVMLARPHEVDRSVFLELVPGGYLTGRVVDEDGNDVEGVTLVLEARGPSATGATGARRTTRTDPAGVYLFEDVLDGEYRLMIGVPESPLAPARELAFQAPSLTMPTFALPVLGSIEITVFEPGRIPAPGILVTGFGKQGGRIDVTTDDHGKALARFLPGGWFTLLAQHGDAGGGRTRARVEVDPGGSAHVEIVLRR